MKHFKKHQDTALSFVNDNENYIIFNDGKPIIQNIESNIEVKLDEHLDTLELCRVERSDNEKKVIKKSDFISGIFIKESCEVKCIYINDDSPNVTMFFDIDQNVQTKITNIYLSHLNNVSILTEYNLKNYANAEVVNFNNLECKCDMYVNSYIGESAAMDMNSLNINKDVYVERNSIYLYSRKSRGEYNNSIINSSSKKQNYTSKSYHLSKDSKSNIVNYAVALNNSYIGLSIDGVIKQGCSKVEATQSSKGLILDDESSISALPWLEIDEYDVQAAHGASIGAIDKESLYYLMSRGLNKKTAQNLIIRGLFNPYLTHVNGKEKEYIENKIIL